MSTRFIDEAYIKVIAGHGGPGSVSFRRETFVPRGGPDGGDGGKGGDVILETSLRVRNLRDLRYKKIYKAQNGFPGLGANKTGKAGKSTIIYIPPGTIVTDALSNTVICDLAEEGQTFTVATGGRGGKGNTHFVSSTFQAPKFSQPGEEGQQVELKLELKLIADVGIIGLPNAGKSTLIAKLTNAQPKIAAFKFTTISPNLGVRYTQKHQPILFADIPGLIKGASQGKGLGHRFLKHIERTKLLLHLLDAEIALNLLTDPFLKTSPAKLFYCLLEAYQTVQKELEVFNPSLLKLPQIVLINKVDCLANPETIKEILNRFNEKLQISVIGVSALYEKNLDVLFAQIEQFFKDSDFDVCLPDNIGIRFKRKA